MEIHVVYHVGTILVSWKYHVNMHVPDKHHASTLYQVGTIVVVSRKYHVVRYNVDYYGNTM